MLPPNLVFACADTAAQQANSPAIGRHLTFTPGTANTRTAENSNRNSNNELPLAALPGEEVAIETGNSQVPVQGNTSSGTPSNESQGLSMGAISNITNKVCLATFVAASDTSPTCSAPCARSWLKQQGVSAICSMISR